MSTRWQYHTVEVKPKIWGGFDPEVLQQHLSREGVKGWEFVQAISSSGLQPMVLIFKKEA